jgi:hypothetical protein
MFERGADKPLIAMLIAVGFVVGTIPISVSDIVAHLLHYENPALQRHVIRILFFVPLFSICSFVALAFPHEGGLAAETVRDGYEALVIYSLMALLLEGAGGEAMLAARLRMKPAAFGAHLAPLNWCCRPWPLGSVFLQRCKLGILQYVVVRILLSIVTIFLVKYDMYDEGNFSATQPYVYIVILTNFSQMSAIYCLLLFFQAAHEELAPLRAWSKLIAIKTVVFATWWQGVALAILVQLGLMPSTLEWSQQEVAKGLQNLVIDIEMLIAALAFRWAFPFVDFSMPERAFSAVSGVDDDTPARAHSSKRRRQVKGRGGIQVASRSDSPRSNASDALVQGHSLEMDPQVEMAPLDDGQDLPEEASGDPAKARRKHGVLTAILESTLPLDLVKDLRRTVLPATSSASASMASRLPRPRVLSSGAEASGSPVDGSGMDLDEVDLLDPQEAEGISEALILAARAHSRQLSRGNTLRGGSRSVAAVDAAAAAAAAASISSAPAVPTQVSHSRPLAAPVVTVVDPTTEPTAGLSVRVDYPV